MPDISGVVTKVICSIFGLVDQLACKVVGKYYRSLIKTLTKCFQEIRGKWENILYFRSPLKKYPSPGDSGLAKDHGGAVASLQVSDSFYGKYQCIQLCYEPLQV